MQEETPDQGRCTVWGEDPFWGLKGPHSEPKFLPNRFTKQGAFLSVFPRNLYPLRHPTCLPSPPPFLERRAAAEVLGLG